MKRQAAIDLGSNSVLLTVVQGTEILHDEARVVGLGKGLGDRGQFDPERMTAALQALRDYAKTAQQLGVPAVQVLAVATSASRRATNAKAFYSQVQQETGLHFQIISGKQEALYSFLGARSGMPLSIDTAIASMDLGGGSTEVVFGDGHGMRWSTSLELGSARLTEDFLRPGGKGVEAMQAHIQKVFQTVPRELPIETVIAMAGTATTLGAIDLGLTEWKPELVHGHRLTLSSLNRIANQLQQCTLEQKRSLAAVSPKRAEFLLAGARIIEGLLTHLQRADCTLTVRGLRFGILEGQHL